MTDYQDILKQYWGYDHFRGIQEDIIRSIGSGKDTLGLMPTGGGKSITFQVPALAQEGICLVITPLIALMKDQVKNLVDRGIKATAIYSGMTREQILIALDNCIFGNYKFLYISPERLDTEIFQAKLKHMKVSMITVDESHCISQWGYDFRPAYLKIAEVRDLLPGVPVLALTATATPEVVKDIQERLSFKEENVFRMSFERKNLAYIVRNTEDKWGELLHILKHTSGSAIVYTRSRKKTKEIAEQLNQQGFTATFYHAGLNNELKDQRQKSWSAGEQRVMVATNAFGMGIDKPDVRLVVHVDFPDSPEAYFQEAGRGGRDGLKAYAVLLHSKSDRTLLKKRIADTFPEKDAIRQIYEHINYYFQMPMGEGQGCVKAFNIDEFCRNFKHFPIQVDSALHILTRAGYLEYTDEQDNRSRLMFTIRRDDLYQIRERNPQTETLLNALMRTYTGLFSDYAFISENSLAVRTGLTRQEIYNILILLSQQHILHYIPGKKTPYIIYTTERRSMEHIVLHKEVYEDRKESYVKRIKAILDYADADDKCRSRMLLRYFGEKNEHNCGQCDVCQQRHESGLRLGDYTEWKEKIESALKESPCSADELLQKLTTQDDFQDAAGEREKFSTALTYMLSEELIGQKDGLITISE